MIKKGFIAGIVTVGIVLALALALAAFTEKWSYLYFVSGTMGAVSLVLALAYLIDSIVLGSTGTFFSSKKTRKVSRVEDAKRFGAIAVPNILAALIYVAAG
ncbi:hypothetical protein H8R29_20215 [Priestia megaterium]|uniref:Putative membrane protein n=1 Tax=Priestia megaterium (strain ATCC 14581 / DSM 32 / CCUG 1817 / JCM 2506 / NBRC 15308 / NCIMB 9376 / NCTC 10342 / NRRL B-14308 / VKM B-512 / Ford 19) TaxID=1348623 RepID=A0A0B6AVC7_PRIM2|nr:hypothetical protein [Priestia megaterium]AJI24638.1 putative membrane protein [Priestia megaterium NBRC 15308 = ATCC 14581]KFN06063.1 putative membrane protein [Priestia megaterium]KGJ82529.1 hypothetical protein BMT_14715 [Priestia megaterium NBRC 15308 = ATCC 14581]MDR4231880.1 hypothetical protein [Priestia megaterium]MED3808207.1 hypothetical protein [Priestia megaterium]